jgi:hypothetical protein
MNSTCRGDDEATTDAGAFGAAAATLPVRNSAAVVPKGKPAKNVRRPITAMIVSA